MIKLMNNTGELVFILEPGNITKLQMGQPLSVDLSEFRGSRQLTIYWTPDILRLALEMAEHKDGEGCIESTWLDEAIKKSLEWQVADRVAQ
jgi:hypothetical protein